MDFPLLNQVRKTNQKCEKHGTYLVFLKGKEPFCPECVKERIDQAERERVNFQRERHHRRKTIEVLKRDSILGDDTLLEATFENYEQFTEETTKAVQIARQSAGMYLQTETNFNTILTGTPGAGKSHLAMAMLKAVNEHSNPLKSCLFVSVNDLFRLIKDSISNKQSRFTEENMVRLLTEVDLLVLDDLGSESSFKREMTEASEYNQRILFAILNSRNRTIITTNLNSEELRAVYNPKIVSRIFKGIEGHVIKFTEETKDRRENIKF